jgi:hypothetical protein
VRSVSSSDSTATAIVPSWLRRTLNANLRLASLRGRLLPLLLVLLGGSILGTAGCGHVGVKAHQRELLADRIMKLDGDAQEQAADEHVLSNREGAIGGTGTSGGGCGCN